MHHSACCICAIRFRSSAKVNETNECYVENGRCLPCCARQICRSCLKTNSRFLNYCPYCQIASAPSVLPVEGLRQPPPYTPRPERGGLDNTFSHSERPPSYGSIQPQNEPNDAGNTKSKCAHRSDDVVHYIDLTRDTISSLSLRYGVPQSVLCRRNTIYAEHLLATRKIILIPADYYSGKISLSPTPLESEEAALRTSRVVKWMQACKSTDYEVASTYLEQADYDLALAVQTFQDDVAWEFKHPRMVEGGSKRKDWLRR